MNVDRFAIILLILVPILFVSGCPEYIESEVTGAATIQHINIDYKIDLTIKHPNDFDFTISSINIVLKRTNGEFIGSGTINTGTIAKHSTKHVYGNLKIGDALLKAENDAQIALTVDATATAKPSWWIPTQTEKIHKYTLIENPMKGKTELQITI